MAQTFAGARARLRVGGKIVGFTTNVSGGEAVNYEEIHVLGLLETKEHAEVGYTATLNGQFFRLIGRSKKSLGIFPTAQNILTNGELSASIEDLVTRETPHQFIGVKAADADFDLPARGVERETMSFVAIRHIDEFERPLGG